MSRVETTLETADSHALNIWPAPVDPIDIEHR
jgi:hypothetical protein